MSHKVLDVNATTGEQIVREMTSEELAQLEKDNAILEAEAVEKAAKEAARQTAKAKLSALGLDEAEVNALLGL